MGGGGGGQLPNSTSLLSDGLAQRLGVTEAGKQEDLGSIPLRPSFLFEKVVVCGHSLVTLALIAAHLNAGVILMVTV